MAPNTVISNDPLGKICFLSHNVRVSWTRGSGFQLGDGENFHQGLRYFFGGITSVLKGWLLFGHFGFFMPVK